VAACALSLVGTHRSDVELKCISPDVVAEQPFAASALMFDGDLWDDHHPATLRQAKAASLTWRLRERNGVDDERRRSADGFS
jgi:hypothetical protein